MLKTEVRAQKGSDSSAKVRLGFEQSVFKTSVLGKGTPEDSCTSPAVSILALSGTTEAFSSGLQMFSSHFGLIRFILAFLVSYDPKINSGMVD